MKPNLEILPKRAIAIVFTVSFLTILVELILSRMSAFYLNYSNSFLAIPITLFGLALGSLHIHLWEKTEEPFDVGQNLLGLLLSSMVAFTGVFLMFSQLFPIVRYEVSLWTLLRGGLFCAVFIVPFYFVGKILTILFTRHRGAIGRLYGWDLLGAAGASFVTPIMLHFMDLPYLIFLGLVMVSIVTALVLGKNVKVFMILFMLLDVVVLQSVVYLEGKYDLSQTLPKAWVKDSYKMVKAEEIAHRWNEYSRVSLLKVTAKKFPYYRIIHDNAESNVGVGWFHPVQETSKRPKVGVRAIPYILERNIDDIFVMFAGTGLQMLDHYYYSGGKANITGVELNPLVKEFAVNAPALKPNRLKEFYDLPNVNLVIQEGRSFLEQDFQKYDLIFVASDAATAQYKTGNTRKYLDTLEAMRSYLNHLNPEGLLIFQGQPGKHKMEALKHLFAERKLQDFQKSIIVFSAHWGYLDSIVVSLRPFTSKEIETIQNHPMERDKIFYAPGNDKNRKKCEKIIREDSNPNISLVTDDRPYIHDLTFSDYQFFPSIRKLKRVHYYKSWIRISTLILVCIISFGIFIFLYWIAKSKTSMPPPHMMAYLMITGFCYMLCEVTYIAKLELFMGNLLYSMALLFSIFLIANGLGSTVYDRFHSRLNMKVFPLLVAGILWGTLWLMDTLLTRWLSLGLIWKIPMVIVLIFPSAFCLGLFYPYVVTWLSKNQGAKAIPVTYGISTISSVVGATYAMTLIINLGYKNMLLQAVLLYTLLSLGALALAKWGKKYAF